MPWLSGIQAGQLVVHSDNGAPMKGEAMPAMMQRLGVAPSRSRPSVRNDNPYSESLFRTLKYRPELPVIAFQNLLQARNWHHVDRVDLNPDIPQTKDTEPLKTSA